MFLQIRKGLLVQVMLNNLPIRPLTPQELARVAQCTLLARLNSRTIVTKRILMHELGFQVLC